MGHLAGLTQHQMESEQNVIIRHGNRITGDVGNLRGNSTTAFTINLIKAMRPTATVAYWVAHLLCNTEDLLFCGYIVARMTTSNGGPLLLFPIPSGWLKILGDIGEWSSTFS